MFDVCLAGETPTVNTPHPDGQAGVQFFITLHYITMPSSGRAEEDHDDTVVVYDTSRERTAAAAAAATTTRAKHQQDTPRDVLS